MFRANPGIFRFFISSSDFGEINLCLIVMVIGCAFLALSSLLASFNVEIHKFGEKLSFFWNEWATTTTSKIRIISQKVERPESDSKGAMTSFTFYIYPTRADFLTIGKSFKNKYRLERLLA